MFPSTSLSAKVGATRKRATEKNRAQARVARPDNREGRADRRLCSGVMGPPYGGSLVPRLHAAGNLRAPGAVPARRGPSFRPVNLAGRKRKGIRRPGARRRRHPGPPLGAPSRRPHGALRGSHEPRTCVEVCAPRGSRSAPSGPGIPPPASGHRRRESGVQIGPRPTPGAAAGRVAAPRESSTNFAGGEGPRVAPTPPAPARPGRQTAGTPRG